MNISERQLDRTLIALADPTRRALLAQLTSGEARVTDLAKPFALSLNTVSKHLKSLERAGLVKRRRVGREHWLTLRPAELNNLTRWIGGGRARGAGRGGRRGARGRGGGGGGGAGGDGQ